MGWDCPCGASVGTQRHWCEALQARHAERVERLLALQTSLLIEATGQRPTGQATAELMALTAERREDMHE